MASLRDELKLSPGNLGLMTGLVQVEKEANGPDAAAKVAAGLRDESRRLAALDLGLPAPPASAAAFAGRGKKDTTPEPLGPGGGGYDPAKRKAGRRGR